MKLTYLTKTLYALIGTSLMLNGLWMLVQPESWHAFISATAGSIGPGNNHLTRELGGAHLFIGATAFWCLRNYQNRLPAHWGLCIFFTALAGISVAEIYTGQRNFDMTSALMMAPALLLILTELPFPSLPSTKRQTGTVKWFNKKKGFGFIISDDGEEIFVHFKSITDDNIRVLREGQAVEFKLAQGEKGPQAEDVKLA